MLSAWRPRCAADGRNHMQQAGRQADDMHGSANSSSRPPAAEASATRSRAPLDGATLLMIEDDPDDAFLVRRQLETAAPPSLRIVLAARLETGMEHIASDQPDVVLLDLTLPDSAGLETFTTLNRRFPSVPVLVLSGLDDRQLAAQAVEHGAQDYLVKGRFDADTLLRSIRYALQRQRLVVELRDKNSELEAAALRLKRIIDSYTDGILILDAAGTIRFANPASEQMYGLAAGSLVGTDFGTPYAPAHLCAEIGIVNALGRCLIAEIRVSDIPWQGESCRLVTLRDITKRRAAEDALTLYRDRLEDVVRQRTAELSDTNRQLAQEITQHEKTEQALREAICRVEEHDRSKSEFVFNVSHELKTPLASITYAVENLLKGVVGAVPPRQHTYLELIRDDAHRLHATINDILDFSRIESNTLRLSCVTVPLGHLARQALPGMEPLLKRKHHTLRTRIGSTPVFVHADPQKLQRVIINILGNAIKYTPPGGVIEIAVSCDGDGRQPTLSVTDNGVGIAAEHIEHVTERYYRVGEYVDGTGLGLALSKQITELHGGAIRVQSPPPGAASGTRVTVHLPPAPSPLVMIVNGDPAERAYLERQLGACGYRTLCAADGGTALEASLETPPDAVLVDLALSGMDGLEVIGRLRSRPELRRLPIVVLTGATLDPPRREQLERFGVPAAGKPCKIAELIDLLSDTALGKQYLSG